MGLFFSALFILSGNVFAKIESQPERAAETAVRVWNANRDADSLLNVLALTNEEFAKIKMDLEVEYGSLKKVELSPIGQADALALKISKDSITLMVNNRKVEIGRENTPLEAYFKIKRAMTKQNVGVAWISKAWAEEKSARDRIIHGLKALVSFWGASALLDVWKSARVPGSRIRLPGPKGLSNGLAYLGVMLSLSFITAYHSHEAFADVNLDSIQVCGGAKDNFAVIQSAKLVGRDETRAVGLELGPRGEPNKFQVRSSGKVVFECQAITGLNGGGFMTLGKTCQDLSKEPPQQVAINSALQNQMGTYSEIYSQCEDEIATKKLREAVTRFVNGLQAGEIRLHEKNGEKTKPSPNSQPGVS